MVISRRNQGNQPMSQWSTSQYGAATSMNESETAGTDDTKRAQDVRETFTAEEYELSARQRASGLCQCKACMIDRMAYRIAANAMRPGVIEDAIAQSVGDQQVGYRAGEPFVLSIPAAAIRKALLGEAEDAGR